MSPLKPLSKGAQGELLAKKYLQNKGYKFITANFSSIFGEIDLIFQDDIILVFVEVKTRLSDRYGAPEEAVTSRKLNHLIKTAEYFLVKYPNFGRAFRLDVVAIDVTGIDPVIRHLKNVTS